MIEFGVAVDPVGQPRPRGIPCRRGGKPSVRMIEAPAGHPIHRFKSALRLACERAIFGAGLVGYVSPCPIRLEVRAWWGRPKSHLRKGGEVREGAPLVPSKPDADNVAKAIADAIEGLAFRNDAQVADLLVRKRYGSRAGVAVYVHELTAAELELDEWDLAA